MHDTYSPLFCGKQVKGRYIYSMIFTEATIKSKGMKTKTMALKVGGQGSGELEAATPRITEGYFKSRIGKPISPRAIFLHGQLPVDHMSVVGRARAKRYRIIGGTLSFVQLATFQPCKNQVSMHTSPSRQARGITTLQGRIPAKQEHSRRVKGKV